MDCSKLFSELQKLFNESISEEDELTPEKIYEVCSKLKNERDIYYLAMDNCTDSFHIADGNGDIIFINKTFEKRTKISKEYVIGKNVADMPYKPSAVVLALKEQRQISIIQGGPGGDAVVTTTPVFDEDGTITLCVSNARYVDDLSLIDDYICKRDKRDETEYKSKQLISKDENMSRLYEFAKQIAGADTGVLITGETGTGKSMLARYIHDNSLRKKRKFIELNCAAIPANLIESELFGYESGAFTGAQKGGKPGLFELADGGTLFLDEIGDMPLALQPKLLHAIQNRSIMRIGGTKEVPVDVRIITATNKDLEKLVAEELFRSDLYYRINVVPIHMPALRERKDDITGLMTSFLNLFNSRYGRDIVIDDGAVRELNEYRWPGNIRELENMIERLVVTNRRGIITEDDLPNNIKLMSKGSEDIIEIHDILPLKTALEKVEEKLVQMAFEGGNSTYEAAKLLGISQSGASRKYIKYVETEKTEQPKTGSPTQNWVERSKR